jgi:subtilisin-like proprotein convertase family protein
MSYAGACGVNNVQNSEDEYYHQGSLFQIYNHTRNNNLNCPDITPTTNHFPTVNILTKNNTIIPKETPFILDGEGFDEDGDKLKFNFEEKDASTALCELGSPTGTCPQFRSVLPDTFPYRIIPRPSLLLSGTGDKDEVLPTYSRELKFAFTARDNNPEGGVASWKEFKIQVDASGGPFQVVSPNNGENYSQGQIIEALWNVSNTDKAPFHTEFVDIYLSTKNAIHPSNPNLLLLQGRVPNTGKAKIQLPDVVSNSVRLYIKAHNSIFFDMSNFKFILKEATTPTAYIKPNKYYDKLCLPALSTVNFQTTSIAGYNGMIKYELTSIPDLNIKASFEKEKTIAGEENNLNINFQNNILTGYYSIGYRIILDNNDTLYKKIDFDVISTDFSTVTTLFPNNGEKDAELPTFRWTGSPNATSYTIEVSKSPLFTTIEAGGTVTDTFYKPSKTFDKKSLYYWRVRANNECTEGEWLDIQAFGTLAQDCKNYSATGLPLNISQSGQPIITPKINIPTGTNISDVNVTKLKINHTNFADLTSTLISPVGTKVILWEKICPKSMNIEVLIDDQAPGAFSCANNASGQYTPKEKLSKFNGENATGAWTLEIQDGKTGNGGKLDIFELEICASVPVQDPYQVKNNLLTILPTDIGQISNEYLLVEDNNNNANELTYSLSKIPVYGNLLKNGTKLNVGDKFTQNDINTGALTYAYTGDINESVDDGFNFAVQDTEGGWLGINRFNIRVNSTTATKDEVYFYKVNIYPNPANDILNIEIVDSKAVFNKLIIRNTIGQEVLSQSITSNRAIVDIDNLDAGIYLLEITNGVKSITTKFIAQ